MGDGESTQRREMSRWFIKDKNMGQQIRACEKSLEGAQRSGREAIARNLVAKLNELKSKAGLEAGFGSGLEAKFAASPLFNVGDEAKRSTERKTDSRIGNPQPKHDLLKSADSGSSRTTKKKQGLKTRSVKGETLPPSSQKVTQKRKTKDKLVKKRTEVTSPSPILGKKLKSKRKPKRESLTLFEAPISRPTTKVMKRVKKDGLKKRKKKQTVEATASKAEQENVPDFEEESDDFFDTSSAVPLVMPTKVVDAWAAAGESKQRRPATANSSRHKAAQPQLGQTGTGFKFERRQRRRARREHIEERKKYWHPSWIAVREDPQVRGALPYGKARKGRRKRFASSSSEAGSD